MSDAPSPSRPSAAVWFPHWAEALAGSGLPPVTCAEYRRALAAYLRFCQQTALAVTVASARQFMASRAAPGDSTPLECAHWKAALNWFFHAAHGAARAAQPPAAGPATTGPVIAGLPTLGAADIAGIAGAQGRDIAGSRWLVGEAGAGSAPQTRKKCWISRRTSTNRSTSSRVL